MKHKLLFSVIIPLYNKEDYVSDTITSVLDQEENNFEIIIVDDGSTDQSTKKVEEFTDSRIKIFSQDNKGVSSARNLGIKNATGRFIALLDGDDYWYPNHLSELKNSITLFPKQVIFCNNYSTQFSNKLIKKTSFSYLPNTNEITLVANYFRSSLLDSIAWTSATCIDKEIFEKGYYFDTAIKTGEDTELWIRLALDYSFVFNPKATALYKKQVHNSLSKSNQLEALTTKLIELRKKEINNIYFKKFIDLNLFSLAIQYKITHDFETFKKIKSIISTPNLYPRQRFLLKCYTPIIIGLYFLKNKFQQIGIQLSSFK